VIIYSLLAIPISNSISENYGIKLNNTRIELGLKPITENWNLDSVEILKKNGNYCQHWKNKTNDTLNPYHRSKSITFVKSFWFWKNELKSEYDEFVNPNSKTKKNNS
jgi:hypothetical protein